MTIRTADKKDSKQAARLIYDAIHDIAEALTGEQETDRILQGLEAYFKEEGNRLSYENTLVKSTKEHAVAGLVIVYSGSDAKKLDEPILAHLQQRKPQSPATIDEEADEEDFYIDTISVSPPFRGKGIGTELLQAAIAFAAEKGFKMVSLNVEENNNKAKQLYERFGFIFKKYRIINGHTYLYMVKELQ